MTRLKTHATQVIIHTDEGTIIDATNGKFLLLSPLRGPIADTDRVLEICQQYDLFLIEDCAHPMGASWKGRTSGSDAIIVYYSTQTYKQWFGAPEHQFRYDS